MYTAHLWRQYKKSSIQRLTVAYNDGMRLLLKVPRWSSASQLFVSVGVPNCSAVLRNLMYRCMCRLSDSVNNIISTLTNPTHSSVRFTSKMWNLWRLSLYVIMWCGFYVFLVFVCPVICDMDHCVLNKAHYYYYYYSSREPWRQCHLWSQHSSMLWPLVPAPKVNHI